MLDHLEAEKIVKDCIRRVRGFGGGVDSSKKLKEVGIQTDGLVKDLRNTIATDQGIGVPSVRDHRIALSALNMSMSTKVLQVQNMVLFNAKAPGEAEALIAKVSFELSTSTLSSAKAADERFTLRGSSKSASDARTDRGSKSKASKQRKTRKRGGK